VTPDRIVEFAEELSRVAAAGGGPRALAALLSENSGVSVLVEDAQWRHIATAGKGSIPASARGARDDRVTTLPIGGPIALGHLSVVRPNGSIDDATIAMARLCAASIGLELAREADGGRTRRRAFWDRLISGAFADAASAREDASARGISTCASYVCAAFESEDAAELRTLAAETFRGSEGDVAVLERGANVAVLIPAPRAVDAENAKTAALLFPKTAAKRKAHLIVSGGVSATVPLVEVPAGVAAAEAALAIARRMYGAGRVAAYDDLGAYALIYHGASAATLQTFAGGVLAPLRSYDEKHQTELARTLALYFETGQNVKTTSTQLSVHRHTVFYRLRQIGEITGRSLESPHDQLTLRLAIAIDALHT
jgi:purine catabolism regulator